MAERLCLSHPYASYDPFREIKCESYIFIKKNVTAILLPCQLIIHYAGSAIQHLKCLVFLPVNLNSFTLQIKMWRVFKIISWTLKSFFFFFFQCCILKFWWAFPPPTLENGKMHQFENLAFFFFFYITYVQTEWLPLLLYVSLQLRAVWVSFDAGALGKGMNPSNWLNSTTTGGKARMNS